MTHLERQGLELNSNQAKTHGMKTVLDIDAVAGFYDGKPANEFNLKHRTVVRGINVLLHNTHLLDYRRYGIFSYQLFSHKLLKWLVPFFMIIAYVSNMFLDDGDSLFWTATFFLQNLFYVVAALGYVWKLDNKYVKIVSFFVISNIAILKAWISYARGERYVFWEPTKR